MNDQRYRLIMDHPLSVFRNGVRWNGVTLFAFSIRAQNVSDLTVEDDKGERHRFQPSSARFLVEGGGTRGRLTFGGTGIEVQMEVRPV